MGASIKDDIANSLKMVRKTCRLISYAIIVAALIVGLLFLAVVCAVLLDFASSAAERALISLHTFARDAIIIFALVLAARVFSNAGREMSPFGWKQTKRLRLVSVLLAVLVVIDACFIVDYQAALDVLGAQIDVVIATGASLNIPALVLAAVAFCMSIIFQYGALLQEDEDALV